MGGKPRIDPRAPQPQLSGLVAYVQAHPTLDAHTAKSMLRTLYVQEHILRNIGLAPGNRLTYVYPQRGNERAIGLYYPDLPDQWPAVQRAIRDHAPRLAGPVELKQGGIGFIYRVPVFLDPGGRYWGLLSTVINAEGLYASAGIRPDTDGMQVALRGRDGSGPNGQGFFGDPGLFGTDALRAPIHTPGGSWEIAVRPMGGWRAGGPTAWVRPAAWVLGGALALTLYQFLRMRAARTFAQEALAQGNARLKALFDLSPFGIVLTDAQGRFTEWNGALCNMLGGSPDGRAMRDMESRFSRHLIPRKSPPGDGAGTAPRLPQPWNVEYARPDGAAVTLRIHGIEIPQDGSQRPQWYIVEDITEAKVAEQEIRRLAFYDPLTLLPNRRLLLDRLQHALDLGAHRASFSARQLQHPDFVDQVRDALDASGADPSRLRLELTESSMMDAMENAIAKMTELRRIGVGFSLDDFGTGHSSLAYLKRLPLDALKIDRSFVDGLPHDTNDTAIVRTIIALARSLELDLVAEGVESAEQFDFLSSSGCHTYQGYLIDRPIPISEFRCRATGACYPRMRRGGEVA